MSLVNLAPSLPLKFSAVFAQTSPVRVEIQAKPAGILGFIVSLFGGGEDARIVANETSCVVEQRTLFGRRRLAFSTGNVEGSVLARTTKLAKYLAAMVFFLPWVGSLLSLINTQDAASLVSVLFFSVILAAILLRPLKAEFGLLSSGVFHGLSMQFSSAELDKLQGAAACLERLLAGPTASGAAFDFTAARQPEPGPPQADGNFDFLTGEPEDEFDDPAEMTFEEPVVRPSPRPIGKATSQPAAATYIEECPSCGKKLRSKTPIAGRRLRCPGCREEVQL